MNQAQFEADVSAEIRAAIAQDNQPVQVGSPLWNRLITLGRGELGPCHECGWETEFYDAENEDYICDDCRYEIVRGQLEDQRLDDPRHQP